MNDRWERVEDTDNCSPGESYPYDSNIRVNVNTHYVANTDAWDYYAQAQQMTDYSDLAFCPAAIDNNNSTWPELKTVVNQFNAQHPDAINFFFVENGGHLAYLEDAVNNNETIAAPWNDNIPIFSGCARLAAPHDSEQDQFIIMANFYTAYYARVNFGGIYSPEYSHIPNETIAQWHLDGVPITANHELGHSIMNQFHTQGCDNLMSTNFSMSKRYLTPAQLNRMHRTLMTTNHHDYVSCEDLTASTCNIEVTGNATFDSPVSIYGDIIVASDATLTITSEVYLSKESTIDLEKNAKLIVDGGLLTNGCDDTWQGIRVTGGNTDFDVSIKNGSVVENTSSAAVSMFPPLPWPDMAQHGNGILQAENSTFNNTRRIVEFIAFQPSANGSYIRDCVQNGGKWSITNWNCQFVEVSGNVFNDITMNCIVTESGSFLIEGNEFHSGENDILFANVSAGIGSVIRDNLFYGSETGVRALGTTFDENSILNNNFATGLYDAWMEGDNFYEIYSNDFAAAFGSVSLNSGNSVNRVFQNKFDGNFVGLYSAEDSEGIGFYENCFDTYFADTYLDGATISFLGAGFNQPANNCFTHLGNPSSNTYDITGNPDPFVYVEPADNVIDCKDAVKAHPNVSIIELTGGALDACAIAGSDLVTPPEEEETLCSPQRTMAATQEAISFLNTEISLLPPNDEQRKEYERCLKRAKRQLFELYVINEDYSDARSLFSGEEADEEATIIFSSYIFEGDLEAAEAFLTNINPTEEPLADFIKVQLLNLDRLSEGPSFQATVSELDSLGFIAHKEHRYAGYAKSLYYALTGDVLTEDLPLRNHSELRLGLEGRATHATTEDELSVFPNPFSAQLNIRMGAYPEAQLNVTDLLGKNVHHSRIQEANVTIPTNDWAEGLYIVTISRNNEILHRRKVMLAK